MDLKGTGIPLNNPLVPRATSVVFDLRSGKAGEVPMYIENASRLCDRATLSRWVCEPCGETGEFVEQGAFASGCMHARAAHYDVYGACN